MGSGGTTRPDVLLGDFNMVEDKIDRLPAHSDAGPTVASLRKLKEKFVMSDGWRRYHGNEKAFSFKQVATQARSRIDRIYATDSLYKNSRDWEITESGIHTDHQLVSVKLANPKSPYVGKGRWSIPPFALENRKIIRTIVEKGRSLQLEMEDMISAQQDQRTKGDVQHAFAKFKEEITSHIREFTRVEIPKMEARIRKAKENLSEILNNDSEYDIRQTQLSAHEQESLISRLEKERYTKIRDNIAIKHKLEGECLTKYWINQNKEKTPRDTIMRLSRSNQTERGEPEYTTRSTDMAAIAQEYHHISKPRIWSLDHVSFH